jgi:hypothetical protein
MSKINMTYMSFDHYKNLNSTDFLMLCEFIDNSISSFIKIKGGYQDLSECKLKITLDYRNSKNKVLIIEDNANGFDRDTMNDCFKIGHSKNKKPDSDLNAFGIGMKQAGFYLGKKVEITSIDHKNNSRISTELDVKKHNLYDEVEINVNEEKDVNFFQCFDDEKFSTGTSLKISYLRRSQLIPRVVEEKIRVALQSRYYIFLKNNLDMTIRLIINKTEEPKLFKIEPKRMQYENIDTLVKTDMAKPLAEIKNDVIKLIDSTYDKISNKDNIVRDSLKSLIVNHKDFKWDFKKEIIDGVFVSGEIGWLKNPGRKRNEDYPLVRSYGFNLYQSGRAIYSFPSPLSNDNDNQHVGTYRAGLFESELSGGSGYERRWVGYLDMTDLINVKDEENDFKYLKPDSNKRGLTWIDETAKQNFTNSLAAFMNKFNPYLKAILDIFQDLLPKKDASMPDKVQLEIESKLQDQYLVMEKMIRGTEGHFVLKCNDGNNINVFSKIDTESGSQDNFLQYENLVDEKRAIEITLNSKNKIWAPLVNSEVNLNSDICEHYHKLGITFALTQLFIDLYASDERNVTENVNCLLFEKLSNDDLTKDVREEKNFLPIMALIAKEVFKF